MCGTGDGILNLFSWGEWGDISDRFPGHPLSIDSCVAVSENVVCTGSMDGVIRYMYALLSQTSRTCMFMYMTVYFHNFVRKSDGLGREYPHKYLCCVTSHCGTSKGESARDESVNEARRGTKQAGEKGPYRLASLARTLFSRLCFCSYRSTREPVRRLGDKRYGSL